MVRIVLNAILGTYEADQDEKVSQVHKEKIWDCVAKLEDDDLEQFSPRVIDVLNTSESTIEKHRERSDIIDKQGPIVVDEGKTWLLHGAPLRRSELLNFAIDVESYLEIDGGPVQAELALQLLTGERFTKAIEPRIFNKKERFDDEILGESFGTRFELPNASVSVQECLDELRLWVHHQDAPRRRGVRHMGVYDDELAIPGHTLGPDGWIDEPETVYLEREIGTERRVNLPTDRDSYDEESVAEILETLPHTREAERFLPVLGWFYAAPFRSTIDSLAKDAEFNHLNITGDTGSGKTASLSYLWRCFGMGGEPFSVDMSAYAQVATFSSTNSLPLWFDEYKPSDIPDYKLDRFHDKLRKANKGAFAERGNADKTTSSYQIKAPCVVSGEQSIQGPAERRRTIMTQFRSETTDPGTDTAERFKQLVGKARVDESGDIEIPDDAPNPDDHALAYYQFVTATELDEVRSAWHDALTRAHRIVSELDVRESLDDLEIQGLQTVAFGFGMYRKFAEAVGADTTKLPSESDLDDALKYVVERIGPKGSRKSHADQFVELFGRAAAAGYVKRDEHYTLVREGQPREELRINLPRSFDALSKYARDHDLRSDDLLNDYSDYRDRFREMEQTSGSYIECVMQVSPPVSKCTGISTVKAIQELEFDRAVVTNKDQFTDSGSESSDSDNGGAPPSVDSERAQQQTATTDGGEGPPDDAKGSLADARRLAELLAEQPGAIGRPSLAGAAADVYDMEPDRVERAIDKGLEKGIIVHSQGNLTNNSGG